MSELTPLIAIHMTAAIGAVVTGPVALWARKGAKQRPRLHRAFGYAWVTLMVITAVSAIFIKVSGLPNIAGYTPIHLLIPVTLAGLVWAFVALARGDIDQHRKTMQRLYFGACIVAGMFTLMPGRLVGDFVWTNLASLDPQAIAALAGLAGGLALVLAARAVKAALARAGIGPFARDPW